METKILSIDDLLDSKIMQRHICDRLQSIFLLLPFLCIPCLDDFSLIATWARQYIYVYAIAKPFDITLLHLARPRSYGP